MAEPQYLDVFLAVRVNLTDHVSVVAGDMRSLEGSLNDPGRIIERTLAKHLDHTFGHGGDLDAAAQRGFVVHQVLTTSAPAAEGDPDWPRRRDER